VIAGSTNALNTSAAGLRINICDLTTGGWIVIAMSYSPVRSIQVMIAAVDSDGLYANPNSLTPKSGKLCPRTSPLR
jgi:hypothetical protein